MSVAELPAHAEGEFTVTVGLAFTVSIIVSDATQPKFVFTVKRTMADEVVNVMLVAPDTVVMLPEPVTKLHAVELTASPGLGVA